MRMWTRKAMVTPKRTVLGAGEGRFVGVKARKRVVVQVPAVMRRPNVVVEKKGWRREKRARRSVRIDPSAKTEMWWLGRVSRISIVAQMNCRPPRMPLPSMYCEIAPCL